MLNLRISGFCLDRSRLKFATSYSLYCRLSIYLFAGSTCVVMFDDRDVIFTRCVTLVFVTSVPGLCPDPLRMDTGDSIKRIINNE